MDKYKDRKDKSQKRQQPQNWNFNSLEIQLIFYNNPTKTNNKYAQ